MQVNANGLVILQFIKQCVPYNTGEIAGFPEKKAALLLKRDKPQVCVEYVEPKKKGRPKSEKQAEPQIDKQETGGMRK